MKTLNLLPAVSLLVLLFSSTGALAASKNNQQLTDEMATLQQGVAQMQKDMQGLRKLLDNRAMLELFQRMDELSEEASQLRGMLEQQSHDLAGIKKRQRELYLDIDRRLRELEMNSRGGSGPASGNATVVAPGINPQPALPEIPTEPETPPVQQPDLGADAPLTGTSRPATINANNARNVPVSDERAAYQSAFDMLKEGRYEKANASFKTFIETYPSSNFTANAQYWLGESNYVTRKFEQAAVEFNKVLTIYSSSNKVPDAMLKLGYTYYELGRFDEARKILEQLTKGEPNSTAARLAVKRLERMSREGR